MNEVQSGSSSSSSASAPAAVEAVVASRSTPSALSTGYVERAWPSSSWAIAAAATADSSVGRADRPLGVAAAERGLVVGERADERGHRAWPGRGRSGAHARIASRIALRGTMIIWIHGCSS